MGLSIDRDKVIRALEYLISEDCTDNQFDYADEIETAIALLKEQPELVRCKDCKHLNHLSWLDEKNGMKCYICNKHAFTGMRKEEWFCADGERMERKSETD